MKLAAVYCVWDDYKLLVYSMDKIGKLVDGIIIITSEYSNFGERSKIPTFQTGLKIDSVIIVDPDLNLPPVVNERDKRNFGLQKARELGYTHFLMMDADEFYEPTEFLKEKERFNDDSLQGLVCRVKCYFKRPTLTIGYDVTLVPFIHKITPELRYTWNKAYPYAFEGPKQEIRIDPTRQMNIVSGVELSDITMHHYSWIRSDIRKKIRNSTARQNIERSTIVSDYRDAKEGYYCEFYKTKLEACENLFNIPDIIDDSNISESSTPGNDPKSAGLLEGDNQIRGL